MSRSLLLASVVLMSAASAQALNTQLEGFTFTNGLSTLTDTSALGSTSDTPTGVSFLTDNDISTFALNISFNGGTLQGNFAAPAGGSSTGIYFVSAGYNGNTANGAFDLQLVLSSGLTSALSFGDADFVSTNQTLGVFDYYNSNFGTLHLDSADGNLYKYAYLYVAFSDFNVSGSQVLGIRLSNLSQAFPDFGHISAGYAGAPIPEPSTYGLMVGGLALAAVALRRRAKK